MKRNPEPLQILARATAMPKGVLREIELATTSFCDDDGRLSAGKMDNKPAIPAVTF